jgi:proteasome assembly chaperone 3
LNLPPPPTSLSLQALLGTPPPHHETLYPLYASQAATLVWWSLQEVGQARRGVVVGLALEKGRKKASEDQASGDEDEDDESLDGDERDRFMGIMEMIAAWPGPA